MPREIKTTLAVDGEAAFKRAINDANTSIRNMGTQLTLATAQFKKDGDAMKLMESRSKTLKAEIEQQNEIVKALEKAVTDSAKAYGENSEKTEKWEAELNRAKARLVNLQSELTLNNAGLDRNGKAFDDSSEKAADYQATLQTIGKGVSFETITNGINGITSTVSAAITKVIELGKKVTETMREAAQWADDLITESIINGLSVEDQQRMEYASKFADTSVDTIMSARDKLIKKMVGGWKNGDIDMWEFLGIDASTTRDPLDLMFELGETFRGVASADRNDTRADAWAMEVFGKGYRELLPLFNYGRDAFYNKMSEAPIVSDEDVEKLGSLNDKFDEFDSRLNQLKESTLAQLAPTMEGIVDSINDMLESFSEWIQTEEGKEAMSELSDAITELFSGLKNVEFKDVVEKAKDGIKGIKDALLWLAEHKNDVENALKIIAGGFALLKVSELAINIGKIVDGFQALWDGANKPLPTLPGTDGASGGGSGGGIFAKVGSFLRSPAAKALGGLAAFTGVLFENATTPQGNDDILDENGELTKSAKKSGWYKDQDGQVQNQYTQPQIWEVKPQEPKEEITEDVDLDPVYTLAQKIEAAQDWWDAYRNAESGADSYEEEESAFEYLQEVLGEGFGDFWDAFLEKSDSTDMSKMEDLPDSITDAISQNSGKLDEAVSQMRANTDSGKAVADKVAGADFKRFNGLPTEIQAAVQRGAASGVSGIIVRLDGATVGRLVAPYVNAYLGSSIG